MGASPEFRKGKNFRDLGKTKGMDEGFARHRSGIRATVRRVSARRVSAATPVTYSSP